MQKPNHPFPMAFNRQESSRLPIMNQTPVNTQFLCTLPHRPPPIETTSFELLTESVGVFVEKISNETRLQFHFISLIE
jgi:hypothetical protein